MKLSIGRIAPTIAIIALSVALALTILQGNDNKQSPGPGTEGVTATVRQVLESAAPDYAPGRTLELSRVIIPAGQTIAAHTHPGAQQAAIVEGTLTYTVISGQVQVQRAAGTSSAKAETAGAGQTVDLKAATRCWKGRGWCTRRRTGRTSRS